MINYHQTLQYSVRQIAELPVQDLKKLRDEAEEIFEHAKKSKTWIDIAIAMKYQARTDRIREAQDKDTGVIHFEDGDMPITAETPKRVEWDQKKLAEIAQKISAGGEDPTEYIDISYKVAERKYTAWPESLRDSFAPARTLKPGKQTFVFGEASA